jgi:hypothetical protein
MPGRKDSFGELLENFFVRQNPLRLWGFAAISGFLILFMSVIAHLDDVTVTQVSTVTQQTITKQLGIWYAPNWSVVYLVLFPLFLVCISRQASFVRDFLIQSAGNNTIIVSDGSKIVEQQLIDHLKAEFKETSGIFILLAVAVAIITAVGWLLSCAIPLSRWGLGDQAVGWANAQIARGGAEELYKYPCLVYTAIAYIWMGIALYVYLAYLCTAFVYSNFFSKLSQSQVILDDNRTLCMIRTPTLPTKMSEFLYNLLVLCFLGIIAAFLIRLDVAFLYSDDGSILHFWFGDFGVHSLGEVIANGMTIPEGHFQKPGAKDMDLYTSLAAVAATVVAFVTSAWLILDALRRARQFTISKISEDPSFLKKINLTISDADTIKIQNEDELRQVIPELRLVAMLAIGVIFCGVFPRFGILFSSLIAFALIRYLYNLIRRLK